MGRRDFLKALGLGATAALANPWRAMAGPFTAADFDKLVPADKKLDPTWVRSLFERGAPTLYRGKELGTIGMPVGGIGTGQVYLGGDGKLWHWDIFNWHYDSGSSGPHYAKPAKPEWPFAQGFAIRVFANDKSEVRAFDHTGWSDITFNGEYPLGVVEYRDRLAPVSVTLEAFSPFIPLDTEDSALPATVMQFTIKNVSAVKTELEIGGWLENAVCLHTAGAVAGQRRNRIVHGAGLLFLECSAEELPASSRSGKPVEIVLTDGSRLPPTAFKDLPDNGTMGLALLESRTQQLQARVTGSDSAFASTAKTEDLSLESLFTKAEVKAERSVTKQFGERLVGGLTRKLRLKPGATATATFLVTWHFPNLKLAGLGPHEGRWYGKRFAHALAVAEYVARDFDRLRNQTLLWRATWYDATLPYWFLDRTFLNTSILATSTCYWLGNGRFYGWEGVGCCAGTCAHVWHYAHAPARLFPALERSAREQADFGAGFDPDTGRIRFRAEHNNQWAVDGQAGVILRTLREHQMSVDDAFLKRVWPRAKKALEFLITKDEGFDGTLDGPQHNTLDTDWWGEIAWLNGLYLAALRAGEEMAREMGDEAFADRCRGLVEKGRNRMVNDLFDGEYFINRTDPKHLDAINSGTGCEIDQVMGQSWAFQVALGRVLPQEATRTALRSLWRYNFTPDVGPFRAVCKPGRWYAMPGEAGLLMCIFPRTDWDYAKAKGKGPDWAAGYFNECMNGFEYQAAGHMLWEQMMLEGLAVTRAVHDRYHATKRNPWNEIECGDHYARSMASYGVFLAACGFEYHGPKGRLGFSPRLNAEHFRAAFTAAEGWGTFSQDVTANQHDVMVDLKWGRLRLNTVAVGLVGQWTPTQVSVKTAGKRTAATLSLREGKAEIAFPKTVLMTSGHKMEVRLSG